MTTINPTYIQIAAQVVSGRATIFPVAVGRNISQAQDTAEQTAAMIEREVGRLLQLALAAAQLPGVTPASGSVYAQEAPSAAANATAVRAELATELARVDVAVSSRLATTGYTAPYNAGIAALPTLAEIEASTVLAKEASFTDVPTAAENAAEILAAAQIAPIHSDIRKVNGSAIDGAGTEGDPWGPA